VRYVAGERQTWGINFGRSRRRTLETSFWSGPLDNQWRVSGAGRLTGLNVPAPLDRLQVVPYALTRAQDGVAQDWEAGLDARYAVTPTTAVYGRFADRAGTANFVDRPPFCSALLHRFTRACCVFGVHHNADLLSCADIGRRND
jgi:hypothetical protein